MNALTFTTPRVALPSAVLLAVLVAQALPAGAEQVTKTTPADAKGEVEILNVSGRVAVSGWDRAEVQVEAELGRGVERLDFRREGQRTFVKVMLPRTSGSSGSSDLVVRVPTDSSIVVNTVSAEQRIKDVRGSQRLQTVSGDIDTEFGPGEIELKTVSGNIIARGDGGKGNVRATTISGYMQIENSGPELEVNTVTGDMTVRLDRLDHGRIKTTNGDLDLTTTLSKDGRIDAEAINGDLSFNFRGALDAEFDIETFNGDIDNCFGPQASRTREYGPGNALRFTQGKGGAGVRVKTLNGAVSICKR